MILWQPLQGLAFIACLVLTIVCANAAGVEQAIRPNGRTDLMLTRPGTKPVHATVWLTRKVGRGELVAGVAPHVPALRLAQPISVFKALILFGYEPRPVGHVFFSCN